MTDEQIKAQAEKLAEVFAAALPPGEREKIAVEWAAFLAFELDAVASSARREALEETAGRLENYMRGCEETAVKLSDSEDETDNNMYWRADGAADALEILAGELRVSAEVSVRALVGEVGGEGKS